LAAGTGQLLQQQTLGNIETSHSVMKQIAKHRIHVVFDFNTK